MSDPINYKNYDWTPPTMNSFSVYLDYKFDSPSQNFLLFFHFVSILWPTLQLCTILNIVHIHLKAVTLCYWLDQFLIQALNTRISSKFSACHWICLLFISLISVGAEIPFCIVVTVSYNAIICFLETSRI